MRLDKEDIKARLDDVWMYAAFSERMDTTKRNNMIVQPTPSTLSHPLVQEASSSEQPKKRVHNHIDALQILKQPDSTYINSPSDGPRPISPPNRIADPGHDDQTSGHGNPSKIFIDIGKDTKQNVFDPLEEFYAEARELSENKVN